MSRNAVAGLGHLLRERFGSDRVFVDHASIPPADSIPETITAALDQARIVLALIGPGWLGDESSFEAGQRLIDRDDDWIRQELRYAFARGSSVLPILLDGTGHPTAAELPMTLPNLLIGDRWNFAPATSKVMSNASPISWRALCPSCVRHQDRRGISATSRHRIRNW
jgi:hypothetical protein